MNDISDDLRRMLAERAAGVESQLSGPEIRRRADAGSVDQQPEHRHRSRMRTVGGPLAAALAVAAALVTPFVVVQLQRGPAHPSSPVEPGVRPGSSASTSSPATPHSSDAASPPKAPVSPRSPTLSAVPTTLSTVPTTLSGVPTTRSPVPTEPRASTGAPPVVSSPSAVSTAAPSIAATSS